MGKQTKESVIENRGAKGETDANQSYEGPLPVAKRKELMASAIESLALALDVTTNRIAARDRDTDDDVPDTVNILGKYRRWACNSVMRMFTQAIEQVKGDLRTQQRRTYALQHGRSRGAADEFAINQSLDWEDRHELVLAELKALMTAANEGYEAAFEEMFEVPSIAGEKDVAVTVPNLSPETRARLEARAKRGKRSTLPA